MFNLIFSTDKSSTRMNNAQAKQFCAGCDSVILSCLRSFVNNSKMFDANQANGE